MKKSSTKNNLEKYVKKAKLCKKCREKSLIFKDNTEGWAFPLFHKYLEGPAGILAIAEAPNWTDTYEVDKGYLSYDMENTDQTGMFFRELLDSVDIKVEDIIITNTVLCLPEQNAKGKWEVTPRQINNCIPLLKMLIDELNPKVILTLGGIALNVLKKIEPHKISLSNGVGNLHEWYSRRVLPNYHPGPNYRKKNRRIEDRFRDIKPLVEFTK